MLIREQIRSKMLFKSGNAYLSKQKKAHDL